MFSVNLTIIKGISMLLLYSLVETTVFSVRKTILFFPCALIHCYRYVSPNTNVFSNSSNVSCRTRVDKTNSDWYALRARAWDAKRFISGFPSTKSDVFRVIFRTPKRSRRTVYYSITTIILLCPTVFPYSLVVGAIGHCRCCFFFFLPSNRRPTYNRRPEAVLGRPES